MSIKTKIDELSKTSTPSRNITEAIDKYSGTDTKSKTIKEAISKLSSEEEVLYTIYEASFNPAEAISVDLDFSDGEPKTLVFTVASLGSNYEKVSNRVNVTDVIEDPTSGEWAFELADGSEANLSISRRTFTASNDYTYCKVESVVK